MSRTLFGSVCHALEQNPPHLNKHLLSLFFNQSENEVSQLLSSLDRHSAFAEVRKTAEFSVLLHPH